MRTYTWVGQGGEERWQTANDTVAKKEVALTTTAKREGRGATSVSSLSSSPRGTGSAGQYRWQTEKRGGGRDKLQKEEEAVDNNLQKEEEEGAAADNLQKEEEEDFADNDQLQKEEEEEEAAAAANLQKEEEEGANDDKLQ